MPELPPALIWIVGALNVLFFVLIFLDRGLDAGGDLLGRASSIFRLRRRFAAWERARARYVLAQEEERTTLAMLVEIAPKLAIVAEAVQPNGGTSLYDKIHQMLLCLDEIKQRLDRAEAWGRTHEAMHHVRD